MLRTTSGLSRPVLKWVSQATASLGATLAATLIWWAVPQPSAPAPRPELTTGGKFAARALDAVAYDGLDTMPLPRVAAPAPVSASAEGPQRTAREGVASLVAAPERPARSARPSHTAARTEARRSPEPVQHAAAVSPAPAEAAVEPAGQDGFLTGTVPRILPAIASTARGAWAVTASAGESLVSRVVPQIP